MLNYADNAMMAKVRALYGKRLAAEDYNRLLQSKSVADVASYLRNETAYRDTLAEVKEEMVHRGQLETLVRRRSLNLHMSLLRYSYNDKLFMTMYMMENEVRQLLAAIRFLNAGSMDRYIVELPVYLSRYMAFDLFALAKVTTFDQLLAVLAHSGYHGIVAKFRPMSSERPVDIVGCEKALLEYYYRTLLDMVEADYSGETRDDLNRLLYSQIDYHNLSVAYRQKRYFGYSEKRVRESMLQIRTDTNPERAYGALLNARDEREIDEAMKNSYLSRKFQIDWDGRNKVLSSLLERSQRELAHKTFRFSVKPMIVVISYMFLLEIEISNIVNIIEGIRYQLPAEEIRQLLIV
ncbi:V-type ATPase subunit [Ruminococcaceae bacterium OttesenSCG-928-L11]|nr:V-type ATPase subunit [Ruminococcaceae bacterium OttesenSCG-928-L11]